MALGAAGILIAALLAAMVCVASAVAAEPPPVTITTSTPAANNADGDIFLTPTGAKAPYSNGVEILNYEGEVIWFHAIPAGQTATDFRTQKYQGQPVLTFWQGVGAGGVGTGDDYIYNSHYEQIATVAAGNGYQADSHEFLITPQNTALITVNATKTANLTSIGGNAEQKVTDGLIQEINIATGEVLFQWEADGNIPYTNSYEPVPGPKSAGTNWDWFHINSVHLDTNGNLIIDSRNTWAAYEISRTTGELFWTLGGKNSTFAEEAAPGQELDGAGRIFAWQHDPEPLGNNEFTFFDDENTKANLAQSRAVTLQLNFLTDTATLLASDNQPEGLEATSQGNAQTTANGDLFVGWGNLNHFTEFSPSGGVVLNAAFPSGVNTYRAYRLPWLSGTTTEASANPSTATAGGSVTYSATVTSAANGSPTGTVTFTSGATTLCTTEALVGGAGSCSANNAPTGPDTVTATYSGDSSFAGSSGTTSLTVNEAPAITSANSALFTEGTDGSFPVTATGSPSPTVTESGTLPEGVTFSGGVLSGTPTQDGVYSVTFEASNGVGSPAVQSFTLTVDAAPAITSANTALFTEGGEGSFAVTATGSPSPTVTESGTLPAGVTFSGGVLSGTPTQDGVYQISFEASNGVGSPSVQSFTLTVDAAPVITSANAALFTEGSGGSFTVTASGYPSPTIAESGTLPAGVTFSGGVLSGTPTVTGSFSISFIATNSAGFSSQGFTLTVDSKPAITSANKALFTLGTAGSFTVTATGVPSPTISIASGSLPTGLSLSGGVISGTPTQQGTFTITLTATNGAGSASQSFTLTVDAPPAITSANSTSFAEGTKGSFTVTATGTPTPTITEWGNLPAGVTYSKGVLSGDAAQQGVYEITFTASNGIGNNSVQQFTLTVLGLHITTVSLPAATPGEPYSQQLTAAGGVPPYKWKKTGGSLPKGLKLSKTGLISGTPKKTAQTETVGVTVTDSSTEEPQVKQGTFKIVVN